MSTTKHEENTRTEDINEARRVIRRMLVHHARTAANAKLPDLMRAFHHGAEESLRRMLDVVPIGDEDDAPDSE